MSPRRANPQPDRYVARNNEVSWRVRYRLAGTQTSETFTHRGDALDFCADIRDLGAPEALRRLTARTAPATRTAPTLDDVFAEYTDWAARNVRSSRTIEDYTRDYRRAIAPTFGATPVDQITDDAVQAWVDAMSSGQVAARIVDGQPRPLAPKTIGDRHSLLSQTLDYAARPPRRYIPASPCAHTRLPKKRKRMPRAVTVGEWQALHRALQQTSPDGADLALALYSTGARFSEIQALTTLDVDDRGGDMLALVIGHVIRREAGSRYERVKDTKSRAGFRRITVDETCTAMIRRRMNSLEPGAYLFTTAKGARWHYSNFSNRVWIPTCEAINLTPRPEPHGLRHLHVAELFDAGASLEEVRVRLGHESITTTLNTYGALVHEVRDDVLRRLAARRDGPALAAGPVIAGEVTSG